MRLQVEYVMMALKNPADFQKMSFVVCHDHSCLKDGKFNLFFSSFLPFYIFFAPGLVRIHWQWKSTQLYNYGKRVFCKQWKSISPKQLWLLSGENYFI